MTVQTTPQATAAYGIDPVHSNVEFIVRHLMISKVRGRFAGVTGTIETDAAGIPSHVEVHIDAKSIDTREPQRDAHLQSPDFLEVEKYPELVYKSTRTEGTAQDFRLYGDLTMHGVTHEVVLHGSMEGRTNDPWGKERIAFSARASLNRKEYGLNWNQALEAGGVVVGDEVKIELEVQAVKQ